MKLPNEIAAEFTRLTGEAAPLAAVRALADVEGNLGEAYAICARRALHVLSRRVGDKLLAFVYPYPVITGIAVEEDRPFAYLAMTTPDETIRLKFGGLDVDSLRQVIGVWQANRGTSTSPAAPPPAAEPTAAAPADGEIALFTGFCAALKAMMEVDGAVDTDENHFLQRLIGNSTTVAHAIDYLRSHTPGELRAMLAKRLDRRQKLCLLANLMEIAMVDGYLKAAEQELIADYLGALGIDKEEYETLYEVLSIKNNLSIFTV